MTSFIKHLNQIIKETSNAQTISAISLIHTFVNIPALIRKRSVFLSRRARIFTKVLIGDMGTGRKLAENCKIA
jgi:hypothetical protein